MVAGYGLEYDPALKGKKADKSKMTLTEYLAMIFGCDAADFAKPFTLAGSKDPITENYAKWLETLVIHPGKPLPESENDTLFIAPLTISEKGAAPIEVSRKHIVAELSDNKTDAFLQVLQMALLVQANPSTQTKGVTLRGTAEEQELLYVAAVYLGFADKVKNPPENAKDVFEKHQKQTMELFQQYISHLKNHEGSPAPAEEKTKDADLDEDGPPPYPKDKADGDAKKTAAPETIEGELDEEAIIEAAVEAGAEAGAKTPATPAPEETSEKSTFSEAELKGLLRQHIYIQLGVMLDSERIDGIWDQWDTEAQQNFAEEITAETAAQINQGTKQRIGQREPVKTDLTPEIKAFIHENPPQQLAQNGFQDLSDAEIGSFWENLTEDARANYNSVVNPPTEALDALKKQAYARLHVTLSDAQAKAQWQSLPDQHRMIVKMQASEEGLAELDKNIAELDLASATRGQAPQHIRASLRDWLQTKLRVRDISDEQIDEHWSNEQALTERPEEPKHAANSDAAEAKKPQTDKAEKKSETAKKVTKPAKKPATKPSVKCPKAIKESLTQKFTNQQEFAAAWAEYDATEQEQFLQRMKIQNASGLSTIANQLFQPDLDNFVSRKIEADVLQSLQGSKVDEDTYRKITEDVIKTQNATLKSLRENFNLTGTEASAVAQAMDKEGITHQPAAGRKRELVVNTDGSLKLKQK